MNTVEITRTTERYNRAKILFYEARIVFADVQEGYIMGTFTAAELAKAQEEHDLVEHRFDMARAAMKQIPTLPDYKVAAQNAKRKARTATVVLTQDQLEQINIALTSHKDRLNERGIKHPPSVLKCSIEMSKCTTIQRVMSVAQFEIGKLNE